MRKELDEQLCTKYPLIFQHRYGNPTMTGMCWGFECRDGWYDLIDSLCQGIQSRINAQKHFIKFALEYNENLPENSENFTAKPRDIPEEIEQVVALQVKEKYGTLRFYYAGGDEYIEGLVSMAEFMSAQICDVCGNKGTLRDEGWWATRCDEHA
jgi:hypothetical protein